MRSSPTFIAGGIATLHDVTARLSQDISGPPASDALGGPVPKQDAPLSVESEGAVRRFCEDVEYVFFAHEMILGGCSGSRTRLLGQAQLA